MIDFFSPNFRLVDENESAVVFEKIENWNKMREEKPARCGPISAQIMNRYYGGSITQDEILFKGEYDESDPFFSPFPHNGTAFFDLKFFQWMLNADASVVNCGLPYSANETVEMIKTAIDNGRPVFVKGFQEGLINPKKHFFVIYGYNEASRNFKVANTNNSGGVSDFEYEVKKVKIENGVEHELVYLKEFHYITRCEIPVVDRLTSARKTDPRVWMDSDGDGIVNFDEEERFCYKENEERICLDPQKADSDNDGIDDLHEVASIAYRAYLRNTRNPRPSNLWNVVPSLTSFLPALTSSDFNRNGVIDGLEDLNGDGFYDSEYECDPFENGCYYLEDLPVPTEEEDVPDDYTIYAFSELKINDGARCYNDVDTLTSIDEKFCKVAVWSMVTGENVQSGNYNFDVNFDNPVANIGVETVVGSIDSWGRVLLRNRSQVYNMTLYGGSGIVPKSYALPELKKLGYVNYGEGAAVLGSLSLKARDKNYWTPYNFTLNKNKVGVGDKVVKAGESFDLWNGDAYERLSVENGGTLIVHSGEMFVDSLLQLEPNAKVVFDNLDGNTVLHVGGRVLWKTKCNTSSKDGNYWKQVASRFKLVSHTSRPIYIDGQWGGTIYNPLGRIIMGQSEKIVYGRFLAKRITIHQYSKVFRVDFEKNPVPLLTVGMK